MGRGLAPAWSYLPAMTKKESIPPKAVLWDMVRTLKAQNERLRRENEELRGRKVEDWQ